VIRTELCSCKNCSRISAFWTLF